MMWDKRPLWDEKVGLKIFVKERNEACESFDLDTFKRFYIRWVRLGVYEPLDISDEVLEITMRKMVCNIKDPTPEKLAEAKKWLKERGYDENL